jgi:hypothetical protein
LQGLRNAEILLTDGDFALQFLFGRIALCKFLNHKDLIENKKKTKERANGKPRQIEYTSGVTIADGIVFPESSTKSITWSHTKRYHNCLFLLIDLNPCARNLIDYLTEVMDSENDVRSDLKTRKSFSAYVTKQTNGETSYRDDGIKKAFARLREKGLLIQVKRGILKVNPEFFIKNNDKERAGMIKMIIEFDPDTDTRVKIIRENML